MTTAEKKNSLVKELQDLEAVIAVKKAALADLMQQERLEKAFQLQQEMESEGVYKFSEFGATELLEIPDVWRKVGTVNTGLYDDAECRNWTKCLVGNCRFAPEGVAAKPDVPLLHFQDMDHKICFTLCGYCYNHAKQIAKQSQYWCQNGDDGYGGKINWFASPFCKLRVDRIPPSSSLARTRLFHLAEKPKVV